MHAPNSHSLTDVDPCSLLAFEAIDEDSEVRIWNRWLREETVM